MDGGQIDVEFVRWTLACTVSLFQRKRVPMPEILKESPYPRVDSNLVLAWTACTRSVFQSPAVRNQDGHRRLAFVPGPCGGNRELVDVEGRSTRHLEITLPEGTTYVLTDHL